MGLVAAERALYETVWSTVHNYGDFAPGEQHVRLFRAMSGATEGTVLDAGCGSGKGALALAAAGFDVTCCDLTREGLVEDARALPFRESCLWHLEPRAVGLYDYVYCCDVLEHIPTEYTMLVIARLLGVARVGAFLSIALVPDAFGVWVGTPLHQTVRDFVWWRDRLADMGQLVEARDLGTTGVYWVQT